MLNSIEKNQEMGKEEINNDFRKSRLYDSINFSHPNQRESKSKSGFQEAKEIDLV